MVMLYETMQYASCCCYDLLYFPIAEIAAVARASSPSSVLQLRIWCGA